MASAMSLTSGKIAGISVPCSEEPILKGSTRLMILNKIICFKEILSLLNSVHTNIHHECG